MLGSVEFSRMAGKALPYLEDSTYLISSECAGKLPLNPKPLNSKPKPLNPECTEVQTGKATLALQLQLAATSKP